MALLLLFQQMDVLSIMLLQGNAAIAVIDFGGTKTSTNGDFTIQFPTADASNAIIRIA
jgi:hypothetical protein